MRKNKHTSYELADWQGYLSRDEVVDNIVESDPNVYVFGLSDSMIALQKSSGEGDQ